MAQEEYELAKKEKLILLQESEINNLLTRQNKFILSIFLLSGIILVLIGYTFTHKINISVKKK